MWVAGHFSFYLYICLKSIFISICCFFIYIKKLNVDLLGAAKICLVVTFIFKCKNIFFQKVVPQHFTIKHFLFSVSLHHCLCLNAWTLITASGNSYPRQKRKPRWHHIFYKIASSFDQIQLETAWNYFDQYLQIFSLSSRPVWFLSFQLL